MTPITGSLTNPSTSNIDFRVLMFKAYFKELRQNLGRPITRQDINPSDLSQLLDFIFLAEKHGNDFKLRIIGSQINIFFGKDLRNLSLFYGIKHLSFDGAQREALLGLRQDNSVQSIKFSVNNAHNSMYVYPINDCFGSYKFFMGLLPIKDFAPNSASINNYRPLKTLGFSKQQTAFEESKAYPSYIKVIK